MRKYTLALLVIPAVLVYACGGGDSNPINANDDGGGGTEGGGEVDATVPPTDSSIPAQDATVADTGAKDSGGDAHDGGLTDAKSDADGGATDAGDSGAADSGDASDGSTFDGSYPYPLPVGATASLEFAGNGGALFYDSLDGLQWVPQLGAVLISDTFVGGNGTLYKYTPDAGTPINMPGYAGLQPIGNALFGDAGFFTTTNIGKVYNSPLDGSAPTLYASDAGLSAGVSLFNQPNDVVVRSDGFAYVTDPNYGSVQRPTGVYLIKPSGAISAVVGPNGAFVKYNGIALTADQKTLYVGITDTAVSGILKYTVNADGTLTPAAANGGQFITADAGTTTRNAYVDGLTVDDAGNVYVAVFGGVEIYNPAGAFIGFITIAGKYVASLTFGGTDRQTLFIAANGSGVDGLAALYRIHLNVPGGPTK